MRTVIDRVHDTPRLVACLLDGFGLRLLEACRLRVKNVEFGRDLLVVRSGTGDRDRLAMLPRFVKGELRALVYHPVCSFDSTRAVA